MPLLYSKGDYAFERLRLEIKQKNAENTKLDHLLSMLPVASEAAFNSRLNQHEPECLPNTRAELLQAIHVWISSQDDRCIFWLNGIAGTGISTIARTVARKYYDEGELGASYFSEAQTTRYVKSRLNISNTLTLHRAHLYLSITLSLQIPKLLVQARVQVFCKITTLL
ncbi:hypothetical protein F5B22DRAFT_598206 [Xylaria bambusicola]|uniref:uncharacterized protein n=1 Tax=Xylaria bambusicola TaxID=326684 RepID=UPI0020084A9D|nr:uncharacterized protein F5B22DRAFT_598206 [Xylaria bambusicola]KAI0520743.1 hypothetical protein F5B22DRAFT_598206 [Xylaria bambusicola]